MMRWWRFIASCAGAVCVCLGTVHNVSAQESGKIESDFKPDALWDGRKQVPFQAIDSPKMVRAAEADFIDDTEYVLGVTIHGESRAYPTRFVWWHHVVNDTVGSGSGAVPVAITYCSVCNTGIRFAPFVDGKPIKLDFYGLYNGIACFCERESKSVLIQSTGQIVTGSLRGKSVKMEPLLDTTWGKWRSLHPDTLIMSPETPFQRFYAPKGVAEPRGYPKFPMAVFRPTVTHTDGRLRPFDKVLGVTVRTKRGGMALHRAYPIHDLTEAGAVVNDFAGDTPVAVFLETKTVTASAYSRLLDSKVLTFEVHSGDGQSVFYDKETGSRWNIEGFAESGTLKGKSLIRMENHLSQWYGWVATFPETSLYGHTEAPEPDKSF